MFIRDVLIRVSKAMEKRPRDAFPEISERKKLNKIRMIWDVPLCTVPEVSLEQAFERGCLYMEQVLQDEIRQILRDLSEGK